ncbi:MAG: hypothetical protein EOP83_14750 [Verrucomicrobiaceae bacterium]|nr:MAG: hypothetical protein EOP83_14750 [Verrucomicrobiaceae bacterium]
MKLRCAMSSTKNKGDIAEIAVAHHLMENGMSILFPYGENRRYDLVVDLCGRFIRIQTKYAVSKDDHWIVRCRSTNDYNTRKYTSKEIEYIASYDARTKMIIYIPAPLLDDGKAVLHFRFNPSAKRKNTKVRLVDDFLALPK